MSAMSDYSAQYTTFCLNCYKECVSLDYFSEEKCECGGSIVRTTERVNLKEKRTKYIREQKN